MTTQFVTFSAVATLPAESRRKLKSHIEDRRRLRDAERRLKKSLDDIKNRLADAIQTAKSTASEVAGEEFANDYCRMLDTLDVRAEINKNLRKILRYGIFDKGVYNFGEESIPVAIDVESSDFSRLSHCTKFQLEYYDPASGEATLYDLLHYDDVPDEDPEFSVSITLKLEDDGPQAVAVVVGPWNG